MLAHVKAHHIDAEVTITGKGSEKIMTALKQMFEVEVDQYVNATDTDWYKETKENWTPSTEVRTNRQKFGLTQKELGEKIGVSKQYVSDLENNHRNISSELAKKLGEVFKRNYRRFL